MKTQTTHYSSFFAFLFSAIGALLLFTLAFILGISASFAYVTERSADVQSIVYSVNIFFLGLLLVIVSVISVLRFLNKPVADTKVSTSFGVWKLIIGVVGAGLALLLGSLVKDNASINWLLLPMFTIPAVILPIWTIAGLGTRNLSLGSRWRAWSVFGFSLTVTPFILFVLETLIVVAAVFALVFYAVVNPNVATAFEKFTSQFMYLDMQSEEALQLLAPYIMKPVVIIAMITFFSILVPMLEELIKPLVVWILAGKLESAAQGFAFGALSGTGFAIIETFNVSGQIDGWDTILIMRIGTALLHITTSALMGGAIYLAIRERRYLRLLGTYLLAVLLHGLWNASAVTVSYSALATTDNLANILQWASLGGLIAVAVVLFVILIKTNYSYKTTEPVEIANEQAPELPINTDI